MSIGETNIAFGWLVMIVGILTGSLLGMYAFAGPFKPPRGHEEYASLPRRMVRLAHIAFVALPMINILYGQHIDATDLSESIKQLGSYSMIVGMIGVPTLLIAASFYNPIKYLEVIPVGGILLGLAIIAYGHF